jgi:hypothetical protein
MLAVDSMARGEAWRQWSSAPPTRPPNPSDVSGDEVPFVVLACLTLHRLIPVLADHNRL